MATTKDDQPKDDQPKDDQPVTAKASVPALRYVVVYPGISVSYRAGDKDVTVTVPRGGYLDEHVPAEVAAEKGPFLISIGHVAAVSGKA